MARLDKAMRERRERDIAQYAVQTGIITLLVDRLLSLIRSLIPTLAKKVNWECPT